MTESEKFNMRVQGNFFVAPNPFVCIEGPMVVASTRFCTISFKTIAFSMSLAEHSSSADSDGIVVVVVVVVVVLVLVVVVDPFSHDPLRSHLPWRRPC